MKNTEQERPLARGIRETAEYVGVSPSFIRKQIAAGKLKSTRLGRRVLIKDSDLMQWLDAPKDTYYLTTPIDEVFPVHSDKEQ